MAEQQPTQNPTPKPNDKINQNRPIEFPELPADDEKGRILRPEGGIDKDIDPSENQTRYSDSDAEKAAGDGGTIEDNRSPKDQIV